MELDGKVAVITGGAGGIGASAAQTLAERGAAVVVADLDSAAAERVTAEIEASGGKAVAVACDHTDPVAVDRMIEASDALGGVDICFANAGWGTVAPFLEQPYETWRKMYDVNVHGTFLACQAAARSMVRQGRGGSIIVTTSSGAETPAALFSGYCSSKAALNMFVKVLAYELGVHDIRVNAVMPGVTVTPMTEPFLDLGCDELLKSEIPLGRLATPDDIAQTVAYLASDASRYVTGTALLVDGGGTLFADCWFATDFSQRGAADWKLRSQIGQPA